jgi:hypothetical protein
MFRGAVTTCIIFVYGSHATKASEVTRWNHHTPACAVVSCASVMNAREARATRLPKGDHDAHGSAVAAMRQPSTRKPCRHIRKTAQRIHAASSVWTSFAGRAR